jgi:hypothetical protein
MGSAKKSTNAARKARIEEMRRAEQARERRTERASSPLTEARWWPTRPAYEAKLTCPRCRCASYGWLVAAEPRDLTGEFLIATAAELSPW